MNNKNKLSGFIEVKSNVSGSISIRTSLTFQYLKSAILFTNKVNEIENNYPQTIPENIFSEHKTYVIMSIISSVLFLEAAINEIYLDAKEKNEIIFNNYDQSVIQQLANEWHKLEVDSGILYKYKRMIKISHKKCFNENEQPFKDTYHLVNLRNKLIHFKSTWDSKPTNDSKLIEQQFKDKNIKINKYSHKNDIYFPKQILSLDCCYWSIETIYRFMKEFFIRMDLNKLLCTYIFNNDLSKLR